MIKSVSNSEDSPFAVISKNSYVISAAPKKRRNILDPTPIETEITSDSKTNEKKFGRRLAEIGLLTGLIVFVVLRGSPRKMRSKIDQANKNLIDRQLNVGEGKRTGLRFKIANELKRFSAYFKAIFNLSPLKDVIILKALKKTKLTDKVEQKITKVFEKVSVKTLVSSYKNTNEKFENLFADFDEANKKIPLEQSEIINKKIETIRQTLIKGFSETARRERLNTIKREFDGYNKDGKKVEDSILDKVWNATYKNFKKFMKESAYNTFISEEKATGIKLKNASEVNKHKFVITNSLNTLCDDSFKLLIHLDTFIEHNDTDAREIIKDIARPLKEYQKAVKNHENGKKILLNGNIAKNLERLDQVFKNSNKYDKKTLEEVSKEIKSLTERLKNHKRGEINEIMIIYKKYLPEDEFKKLEKSAYSTTNSLEKSVDLETDKLFDKIRDLKLGSAAQDVLSILASVGVVAYGLTRAENNEEKISVTIKYGIPTVGAVAIMVYCTVGLISAGPSLIIGLLSGLAMNQIGTGLDNFMKQMNSKYHLINTKKA